MMMWYRLWQPSRRWLHEGVVVFVPGHAQRKSWDTLFYGDVCGSGGRRTSDLFNGHTCSTWTIGRGWRIHMVPITLPYHFNGMPVGAAYATPQRRRPDLVKDFLTGIVFKFTYLFYLPQSCKDGASVHTYGFKRLGCWIWTNNCGCCRGLMVFSRYM